MAHGCLSDTRLAALLDDDVPCGDLTTESLGIGESPGRLRMSARGAMTLCAVEEAARVLELCGTTVVVRATSGSCVGEDGAILDAAGSAGSLHRGWKLAQTLIEWASGIASAAAAVVQAAGGVPVACTRKHVPGAKALAVKAVRAGGAIVHRLGLSETLLVFPEHALFLTEPPADTVARLHRAQPEKKIVVEVGTLAAALHWAAAGVDGLQLERFAPRELADCRRALDARTESRRLLLLAAGGVRPDNAAAYAAAGADVLVTSYPYTATPRDVRVVFANA